MHNKGPRRTKKAEWAETIFKEMMNGIFYGKQYLMENINSHPKETQKTPSRRNSKLIQTHHVLTAESQTQKQNYEKNKKIASHSSCIRDLQ